MNNSTVYILKYLTNCEKAISNCEKAISQPLYRQRKYFPKRTVSYVTKLRN